MTRLSEADRNAIRRRVQVANQHARHTFNAIESHIKSESPGFILDKMATSLLREAENVRLAINELLDMEGVPR